MFRHMIFDEAIVIKIANAQEWQELLSICDAYRVSVFNRNAFDDGWDYFGRMESMSLNCMCGWGKNKARTNGNNVFTLPQLKEKLGLCEEESDFEIDSGIL